MAQPFSIYVGWYADKDQEFGIKLSSAKPHAALWKYKASVADLAKVHSFLEKEHANKGIVMSIPLGVNISEAKKQVVRNVENLILKSGLKLREEHK